MLTLQPIGVVRSPHGELADAPRQPYAAKGVRGRIELVHDRNLDDAVCDLAGWEYIWVLFWFHRAGGYRPKVLPPRSPGRRRGVLATRSPHRPNPLGMSVVRLESVAGLVLEICDVDMIDGTPVLDIKPYVPWADIVPATAPGWLRSLADAPDPEPGFEVSWQPLASAQLAFLEDAGQGQLRSAVQERLSLGPQPHAYRRIRIVGDVSRLAYKEWRIWFRVAGRQLQIERISSGYRARQLAPAQTQAQPGRRDEGNEPADIELHRRFVARFGSS